MVLSAKDRSQTEPTSALNILADSVQETGGVTPKSISVP